MAIVKRELNEAKETIAELTADNRKLHERIIQLEAVQFLNISATTTGLRRSARHDRNEINNPRCHHPRKGKGR